jgi:ABC-type multidrug transport system ATPase subunit
MKAIEATDLRKTCPGGVDAVKGINLDVDPGEVLGLLGPNGAGKSTTIGMLTTTVAPTGGRRCSRRAPGAALLGLPAVAVLPAPASRAAPS